MKIKKKIQSYFWFFPFCSFIFGYCILHSFLQKKELLTPNIIGKSLQSTMNVLSSSGLSIRLLREQEDPDLPEGVILDQIPRPNQKIRPNQHVFITISKKPKAILTPDFLGQSQKFITKKSAKLGVQSKVYWLKNNYPINTCVAQSPQPDQELVNQKLITYMSAGGENLYIVPNLKDCLVSEVKNNFSKENIELEILHTNKSLDGHICQNCHVIDQKPMAGSIIDLSKKLYLQLQVS